MIVLRESYASISGKRLKGDVVKENHHTTLMIFHPPKEVREQLLKMNIYPKSTPPIKRHNKKHKVNRFA